MKLAIGSPNRQSGISLVEVMIAMAIGLFMAGVVMTLYLNTRSSFRYQEDHARLLENGRFALDLISRDVRMAGYNGCGNTTDFANVVNGGSSSPFLNFSTPVIGYEGGVSTFPSELTTAGVTTGTDAIILLGVDTSSELVVKDHVVNSAQINTQVHSIQAGSILLITDCSHSTLFQMTGPSSANPTNVVHNTGTGSPGNCTKLLGASCPSSKSYQFSPGSSMLQVYSNAYFIAPSSLGNGRKSLYTLALQGTTNGTPAKRELIEGIDNMQIEYGVDINADRSADQFLTANAVEALASGWTKVVSVRIALLAKSSRSDIATKPMSYEFNGSTVTATDKYLYKSFQDTIAIRNRTP